MTAIKKGDRFVAYPDERLARRLFIEVARVAKDGTWADIRICTWAVMWTKRQPLSDGQLPACRDGQWDMTDLEQQEYDHMAMLAEDAVEKREAAP